MTKHAEEAKWLDDLSRRIWALNTEVELRAGNSARYSDIEALLRVAAAGAQREAEAQKRMSEVATV